MDVAAQHDAGPVVFRRQLVAAVEVAGDTVAVTRALEQPAKRIPDQGRSVQPCDQTVLRIIDEGLALSVRGQVAVRIVGEAGRTGRGVLVQAVDRVVAGDADMVGEAVGVVGHRAVRHQIRQRSSTPCCRWENRCRRRRFEPAACRSL